MAARSSVFSVSDFLSETLNLSKILWKISANLDGPLDYLDYS